MDSVKGTRFEVGLGLDNHTQLFFLHKSLNC